MASQTQGLSDTSRFLRRLFGYALMFASVPLYSFIATEYVAAHFHWNDHLHQPFAWFLWATELYRTNPPFWVHIGTVLIIAQLSTIFAIVVWLGMTTRSSVSYDDIMGDSRFITELDELQQIGLAEKSTRRRLREDDDKPRYRIYLGCCTVADGTLHYLFLEGNEHVGVIAPTRTGKGVGPVLINCFTWPGCLITFDPKQEIFYATAAARSERGPVYRWNPNATKDSHSYNFLDTIRLRDIHEVSDAMDLATLLVDPSSVGNWDHWKGTGFDFLAGAILYVKYMKEMEGKRASLADVAYALGDPDVPNMQLYQAMAQNRFGMPGPKGFVTGTRHPGIAVAGQTMINKDARERTSVHSTAALTLALYKDPIIARNTAKSDFQLMDLWNGERPGSLYITVAADQELKMQPMLRMFLTLLIRNLQRAELQYEGGRAKLPWKYRTLCMFDEFSSLGTLKEIELALARIAGYGVQFFLVVQGIPQLYQNYTQYQAVLEGLQAKIYYAPNDAMTAKHLSEGCGKMTVNKKDITVSGGRFGIMLGSVSSNLHQVQKPLLTEQQAMRLKPPTKLEDGTITEAGDIIIQRTGYNPIFAQQMLYFMDPFFQDLVSKPLPPDVFRRAPTISRQEVFGRAKASGPTPPAPPPEAPEQPRLAPPGELPL